MSVGLVLEKCIQVFGSDAFVEHEKIFSEHLAYALWSAYHQGLPEPSLVQTVESVVNHLNNLTITNINPHFEISTKSIFIHGNRSQVKFDYCGETIQRELGDLIFIVSIILGHQKFFEKFTINQFKKDNSRSKDISWDIRNKGQLYLLSRFPRFSGATGSLIPPRRYTLRNISGCLGSYGLLRRPGDMVFTSASKLDSIIGLRNIVRIGEFGGLISETEYPPWYMPYPYPHIFPNYHYAADVFDFSHKHLIMGIGEPTFMRLGNYNSQARHFLHELLLATIKKTAIETDLTKEYFDYDYVDSKGEYGPRDNSEFEPEGGDIGIISTLIKLGE